MTRGRIPLFIIIALIAAAMAGCGKSRPVPANQPPKALPNRTVHVLCYHNVVPTARNDYDTSVADFQAQLGVLRSGGYQSISCSQLMGYLDNEKDIPAKSVIITFDDGRASFLHNAKPMLDKLGMKATLFLITGSVGAKGSLSWDEVKMLAAAGYEIGSHTVSHLNLTKVPKDYTLSDHQQKVRREIEEAATTLTQKLGQPPVAFAYPFGNYDSFAMGACREAGYRMAFSIDPGAIDNQSSVYALPRKMVVNGTSLKSFERALAVEPLHLTGLQPEIGLRYRGKAYRLQAQVADPDALEALGAEAGKGTRVKLDRQTSQLSVTSTLNRGANLVRVFSTGTPRRETAWIVVCDP